MHGQDHALCDRALGEAVDELDDLWVDVVVAVSAHAPLARPAVVDGVVEDSVSRILARRGQDRTGDGVGVSKPIPPTPPAAPPPFVDRAEVTSAI